eukprot:g2306.t1
MGHGASTFVVDEAAFMNRGFPLLIQKPEEFKGKCLVKKGDHLRIGEESESLTFFLEGDINSSFCLKSGTEGMFCWKDMFCLAKGNASNFVLKGGRLCLKDDKQNRVAGFCKSPLNDKDINVELVLPENPRVLQFGTRLVLGFSNGGINISPSSKRPGNSDILLSMEQAKEMVLEKDHLVWDDFFVDFFDDAKDSNGMLTEICVKRRIERAHMKIVETKKLAEQKHSEREMLGLSLLREALSLKEVNNLRSLPVEWRDALIPKESKEGKEILKAMNDIDLSCKNELGISKKSDYFPKEDDISKKLFERFKEFSASKAPAFFKKRIKLYRDTLKDTAIKEVHSLLKTLEATYHESYNGAFRTKIAMGDSKMLKEWTAWIRSRDVAKYCGVRIAQETGEVPTCMLDGFKIMGKYRRLFDKLARETGGDFLFAPVKRSFRVMEKCAMIPMEKKRFKCHGVYDIVRGAIVYKGMKGIVNGAKRILACKEFVVTRVKDRYSPGHETSGGWRDCIINGYLAADKSRHQLEVQLHHESLLLVREDLGGHYIYAVFRALNEALEVLGIDVTSLDKNDGNESSSKSLTKFVKKTTEDELSAIPNASTSWVGGLIGIEEPHLEAHKPGFEVRDVKPVGSRSHNQTLCEGKYAATSELVGGKTLYYGIDNSQFFFYTPTYHNWVCTSKRTMFAKGMGFLRTELKDIEAPFEGKTSRLELYDDKKWVDSGGTCNRLSPKEVAAVLLEKNLNRKKSKRENVGVEVSGVVGNASQNACNGKFYADLNSWTHDRYSLYISENATHFLFYSLKYANYVITTKAELLEKGSGFVRTARKNIKTPLGCDLEFYDHTNKKWVSAKGARVTTLSIDESNNAIAKRASARSQVKTVDTVRCAGFGTRYDGVYIQDKDLTLDGRPIYERVDGKAIIYYTTIYHNWLVTNARKNMKNGAGLFRTAGKSYDLTPPITESYQWETYDYKEKKWVAHPNGKMMAKGADEIRYISYNMLLRKKYCKVKMAAAVHVFIVSVVALSCRVLL